MVHILRERTIDHLDGGLKALGCISEFLLDVVGLLKSVEGEVDDFLGFAPAGDDLDDFQEYHRVSASFFRPRFCWL